MKQSPIRSRNVPKRSRVLREAEYAAMRANTAETFDDCVSEDIFDVEDDRAEVEVLLRSMIH